ncbi:hypothetical protein A2382_03860 [Candidatus Woesebacteria bacterium RIFOXYB1_FULL_38_16]|uniref:Uncharacterized protein n=1 Tax=Candidatus Woesebacteria bacterium RIFOXYB1_FULL_38_16 TaxID=1802538 RepID=A0A1F8CV87_9BACT|nr:MAG: hypothetical protein A2191_03565 [Candidatus Woesebacteria bacterium RIFOXYA1_FULL_38_9]OGM80247.1 MAG: hypothetical protein A2382_03860 [Candidatus Woesebacteria bacterium RIFOXYB1_FULL_38_16]
MQGKTFLKKYGVLFIGGYIGGFIVLVTLYGTIKFPILPGDILIGKSFYLPFASSAGLSLFMVVFFEMYNFMKRF